jgi:DNA-binding SARP family transcriptional activator
MTALAAGMTEPFSIAELIDQSFVLERAGDVSAAFQQAKRALEQARSLQQPDSLVAAQNCLATLHFRTGHHAEAQDYAAQTLSIAPSDSTTYTDALLILGNCAAETHSLIEAEAYFHRAANLSRLIGYPLAQLRSLHGLGQGVYLPRGQFDLALAAEQEVWRIAQEEAWHSWRPFPLTTMAWVYQLTQRASLARETLRQLSAVIAPHTLHQGYHDYLLATVEQDEGSATDAHALLIQARSVAEAIGEPGLSVLVRLGLSRHERVARKFAEAHHWATDAVDRATRSNYQHLRGLSLIERARSAWQLDDVSAAESDLRAAIDVLIPLQTNFDLARAYVLLAALLHRCPSASLRSAQDAQAVWLEAVSRIISGGYAFLLEQERASAFPLLAHYLADTSPEVAAISASLLNHLNRVPPPPLNILTLGKFEVSQHGQTIDKSAWHQRKAGELFRLLLISTGHTLTRDEIIETLWPDKSIGQAQPLFHRATSQLRRVLESDLPDKFPSRYLEVDEGRVVLHLPIGSRIDFEEFEQSVCREQWSEALACYGGDLFPDDRYADWAAALRERLIQRYLRILITQAQLDFSAADYAETLDRCRRALAIEPWHEAAAYLVMRAHLAQNDRPSALRVYRTLERTLHAELGLAPMPELQALFRSITHTA